MLEMGFNTLDDKYSEITPEIARLSDMCVNNSSIDSEFYTKYKVNRGLRDLNGNGVLTGLTEISEIQSFENVGGEKTPCEGRLFYRGLNIYDIVRGFVTEKRFGFEEVTYLLIFGSLPTKGELEGF
ncbi:MAG: citrate/2-methylcitrate synthase, partial [Anaerovorax sp.]